MSGRSYPKVRAPRGYHMHKDPPPWCFPCGKAVPPDSWRLQRGRWVCQDCYRRMRQKWIDKPENRAAQSARRKLRLQELRRENPDYELLARYHAYKTFDRKRGAETVPWTKARELMMSPCWYCDGASGGLDRLDPRFGHTTTNVVSCCRVCNHLLSDLPPDAKTILRPALRACRSAGAFGDWTPPQLRRWTNKEAMS